MDDDRAAVLTPTPAAPAGIELRHLRALVAVADELNFGRAAARLYLTQPSLSRQIQALERLVGCELLRRSTHRVELTDAGQALLDRARGLLRDLDDAVCTARSAGGGHTGRIARLWAATADITGADMEIEELRQAFEVMHAQFAPPPGVTVRPVTAGGVPSLLVGVTTQDPATMLYLHGGAHVMGSAFGYRHLAGALAVAADATALVPDYRLAPEHPFPADIDDALCAYLWLLDRGTAPDTVAVVGDSTGAGLAIALLLSLRDRALPLPGRTVLFCPLLDPTVSYAPAAEERRPDLTLAQLRRATAAYRNGHPVDDPLTNVLSADLTGLPPTLVQVGTGDPYLPDAHRLTERARDHGVDVRLQLHPAATHGFHLFWSFLPEAAEALRTAGTFIRTSTHPPTAHTKTSRVAADVVH